MRMQTWHKWVVGIAAACAVVILSIAVAFQPIARASAGTLAHAMGFDLAYDALAIHAGEVSARNLIIRTTKGEPVASIARLDVKYSLGEALRNTRMYGLHSFDVEQPRITLIRHRDGSWNVPIPKQQQNAQPSSTPMIFTGLIRDGSVDVFDQAQGVPSARHLMVRGINTTMDVATNARTTYSAALAYEEAGQSYPIRGTGTIDVKRGFASQRWTSAQLPIAHLVDVGLNSPSMHVAGGSLRNLDARIVGLAQPDGSLDEHVDATASLDKARIAIGGLRKPLRDVHGQLAVFGDGLLLQSIRATVANVPVKLGGGMYHLSSPSFRLTVDGSGDLHDLRGALAQSASLPISGNAHLNVLVEGHPSKPLILIGVRAPNVRYAKATIQNANGLIAFDGQEADIINFEARYLGVAANAHGKLALHPAPRALEMVAGVIAPPNGVPYASSLLPGVPIAASVLATSDSLKNIDGRGIVGGHAGSTTVAGLFDVSGNGVGTVGPLRIARGDSSSLYTAAFIDRPHQHIDALLDADRFRVALPQMSGTLDGRIAGTYERGHVAAGGWTQLHDVHTPYTTVARADARFGETAHHGLALAMDASGIGALGAVATAMVSYNNGTVNVHDATASLAGSFVDARGAIAGVDKGKPRYDLNARLHSANLSSLVALAQPRSAKLLEGSAEGTVHVTGSGSDPSVAGNVRAAEGAVNGLPFHGLDADFSGTPASLAVQNGEVGVGTTNVRFSAAYAPSQKDVSVRAPRADLADFNDFFDQGDMLAGTGSVIADASMAGNSIVTSGNVALHSAHVRNFALGATTAKWSTRGNLIDTSLAFGGSNGTVRANGALTTGGSIAGMTLHARNVNVGNWLAMSGFALPVPVTGIANADAQVAGRFPNLSGSVTANAVHGSVNRIPVQRIDVAATLAGHRGTLHSLAVRLPNARLNGSGTFGLRANDSLALAFNARTNDVGALARTATGKAFDASGAVQTSLTVRGTRLAPRIDDTFTGTQLRYGRLTVPHAAGEVRADPQTVELARTEINLQRGRVLLSGTAPISAARKQIDSRDRPIRLAMTADDVEASNLTPLLPEGTRMTGRLDGTVTARGTVHSPQFGGLLTLAGGSYSSPMETVPVEHLGGQLAFAGTSATLRNLHASLGRGSIDADGRASIPDVHDASKVSLRLNARAQNAKVDAPQYVKGTFDGDIHVTKRPGVRPMVAGTIQTNSARIPLTALYNPKPANAPAAAPPDVGLGLHVVAGRDVRVQSSNVDVGAEGYVNVKGTLASPALAGTFVSTGGTVSFLRTFQIESGRVHFDPSSGIIPYVNAVATTYVDNPPTNVALQVRGPATSLNIAFASNPPYDRQQILGLLVNAQSIGAVQGVAATGSGAPFSASNAINGIAQGQLNELFTRNLLEPFDVAAGGALGLQNLQITNDLQGGFGVNAVKAFGKTMSLVYADTFNLPRRQSLTLQARPSNSLDYSLSMYNTQGESLMALQQPSAVSALQSGFGNSTTVPMDTGANGVDFKVEKRFP